MLKKWHNPSAMSFLAEEVHVDINDVMTWKEQGEDTPLLNKSLTVGSNKTLTKADVVWFRYLCGTVRVL